MEVQILQTRHRKNMRTAESMNWRCLHMKMRSKTDRKKKKDISDWQMCI